MNPRPFLSLLLAFLLALLLAGLAAAGGSGPAVAPRLDPPAPVNITFDSDVLSVAVQGDYAYVGIENIENGLVILDITNPLRPVTMGHARTLGIEFFDFLDEHTLVVSDNTSIGVLDVTNPYDPVWISPMTDYDAPPSTIMAMKYFDGYLYVVGNSGFSIFDLRDPASPQVVYTTDNIYDWDLYDVDVARNSHDGHTYAYMIGIMYTGATHSMVFLDVTSPVSPTIVYSGSDWEQGPALVVDDLLYWSGFELYALMAWDISHPEQPQNLYGMETRDIISRMTASRTAEQKRIYAVVDKVGSSIHPYGLQIIDISGMPEVILRNDEAAPRSWVAVSEKHGCIFIPEWSAGLRILCETQITPTPPSLVWLPLVSQRAN